VITDVTHKVKAILHRFTANLVQFNIRKIGTNYLREMKKVYAGRTRDTSEYRYNRNQLDELLIFLSRNGLSQTSYSLEYIGDYVAADMNLKMPATFVPREQQVPLIEYILSDGRIKTITLQTGGGKATTNETPIKVPNGWKPMGELKVGDKVIAADGSSTNVIAVHPQGTVPVYLVRFVDGRTIEVCGEHLWKVYYVNTSKNQRWRTVNTLEMKRLCEMPNPRVYIPLCDSEQNEDKSFIIPPYSMGAILGDGGISNGSINITKYDVELFDRINSELPASLQLVKVCDATQAIIAINKKTENIYKTELKRLDLMGKLSIDKFIPKIYLDGSTAQRKALLCGLMDTDGNASATSAGGINFSTSSKQLALDVQYLARSLGHIAYMSWRIPKYNHNGEKKEGKLAYRVWIRSKCPSELFSIPRKAVRTNDQNQYADTLKLHVTSVEYIGEKEATCITIDHPSALFVAKDFIVTHNSKLSLAAAASYGKRFCIIIPAKYLSKWIDDIKENFDPPKGRLLVCQGYKQLRDLMEGMSNGSIPGFDVVLITSTSMQDYFTHYEETKFLDTPVWLLKPQDFYPGLGIGLRIIDEIHQFFHLNFKMDLYSHLLKGIYLSATLESADAFTNRMYQIAWPMRTRMNGGAYVKYAEVTAIEYTLVFHDRAKTKRGGNYNHIVYEEWIMSKPKVLANYLEMIYNIVHKEYVLKRIDTQKCLVFAASIEMCTKIRDYLRTKIPNLVIGKYTGEDQYEMLMSNDISISTIGSSGTAVDIPDLITVLMTTAVSEVKANLQALGRLRQLHKYPKQIPHFVYLTCRDIAKHRDYHKAKKDLFSSRVLKHYEYPYGKPI
jgi:superfamily II DNA or RNA helicase